MKVPKGRSGWRFAAMIAVVISVFYVVRGNWEAGIYFMVAGVFYILWGWNK